MGRRKKSKVSEDVVKIEAPDVETKLTVGLPPTENVEVNNVQNEITLDGLTMGDIISRSENSDEVNEVNATAMEHIFDILPKSLDENVKKIAPKTISIKELIKRKPTQKRIGEIKVALTQKPLVSRYRSSKKRLSNKFNLSFKLGNKS